MTEILTIIAWVAVLLNGIGIFVFKGKYRAWSVIGLVAGIVAIIINLPT